MASKTVECLNKAFRRDPAVIYALICNRIPCSQELAEDPFILVDTIPVLDEKTPVVGLMGVLNGVLTANGMPNVAMIFSEPNARGQRKCVGFTDAQQA